MADAFDPPEHGPLRDTSTMWRLSLWGSAATVAVAAALLILNADLGLDRVAQALSQPAPDKQIALEDTLLKRVEMQRTEENRRLEARLRELAADRDKLSSRLAALEQNFNDLTGSVKRDMAAVAATALAAKQDMPPQVAAPPAPVLTAPPSTTAPASAVPTRPEPAPQVQSPPVESPARSDMAVEKPPQVVNVPMPPTRVATVTPAAPEEPRKPELGVDLGGARSMEILQARWVAVKANFGPVIDGLRPLAGYDDRPGIIPYRLIVGPLPNGAAAAQICSRLHASKVPCRPVEYAGEKLVQ
ncbi:hypothetical protein [Undibacter mobilis]|uniref:SPOR domain-containing protein n=1 Tax=Undibacter mobilis TaxID=2292256 RepID=A0A371B0S9_9BRAD|nr:hypothetical protein [Undibacter mobilis]RDV01142.1 hypothetical protein DXH78_18070 [Undibacter mobilis]